MGKPSSQPQSSINHCSHPHPLQISNPQPYQTQSLPPCSACKLTLSGSIYSCSTCNYHLHHKCSQTPHQITHPFHQKHHLNLLPTPTYPNGFFNCDACGKQGNGFSYHCKACEIDLHSTCASMPLLVTSPYHNHQLSLVFSSPYPNKSFSCDICKTIASNQWLYRCNACGFDVHLSCATNRPDQGPVVMGIPSLTTPGLQNYGNGLAVNEFQEAMARKYVEEQAIIHQKLQNIRNNASVHTNQDIYQAILGGMAGGAVGAGGGNPYLQSQATSGGISGGGGNPVLNALMGGNAGGGGENPVLNALMGGGGNPMLNAFMGGGGGGGNPVLNALMGGAGRGNPVLNALMGGGGGGVGNDLLNAMGGGGVGGNDLLNAMGGGGGVGGMDFSALGGALGGLGGFGL